MPEPCAFCGEPVYVSKDNYRTKNHQKNGTWVRLIWHTKCDPYVVTTTVTRRNT